MTAGSNTPLLNVTKNLVNTVGFAPSVTATVTNSTTLTITDASTYPSGDSISKINVAVYDKNGGVAYVAITSSSSSRDETVDISGLDTSKPLDVTATVVSTLGCISNGSVQDIALVTNAVYTLGSWSKGETTTAVG